MCTVAHKMNTVLSVPFIRLFPPTWKGGLKICAVCSIDLEHCGKCRDGTHMRAYSYDLKCMECSNYGSNWWKYMLSAFLPLTIFFIIIVMFHINVHSSQLKGFVLFCQLIITPLYVRQLFLYIHIQPNLKNIFYF